MKISILNLKVNSISSNASLNIGKTVIIKPVSNEYSISKEGKEGMQAGVAAISPPVVAPPTTYIPR